MKTKFGDIANYRRRCNLKKELEKIDLTKLLDGLKDNNFPIKIDDKYEIRKLIIKGNSDEM